MDPTFQYAGKVRIPPKQFQLRARIETATRDTVNAKHFEHWQTDTPDFSYNYPKIGSYDQVFERPSGYALNTSNTSNTSKTTNSFTYASSSNIESYYTDSKQSFAKETINSSFDIATGYSIPNYKITNIPYNDMSPTNTRGDGRDYKQSQPFVAGGPDLEYNPYFDRYDPVRDPRNAIRELRSAVYEDKGTLRGESESQDMLRRQFEHRWVSEELIDEDKMDTYLRYEIASAGKK